MKSQLLFSILIVVCSFLPLSCQNLSEVLGNKLSMIYQKSQLPGFAVGIIGKDTTFYLDAFGFADKSTNKSFTRKTVLNIGSITKVFVAVAVMKAVEENKITLDTKINDLLPFRVVNPFHPEIPLTLWHLVTHTSGIQDTRPYNKAYILEEEIEINKSRVDKRFWKEYQRQKKNERLVLGDFLEKTLTQNGSWYSKKNFIQAKPGTAYEYSNIGAALAAYIIELAVGESFSDYSRKKILEPLKMYNSGWTWSALDEENHATLYWYDQQPFPKYSLITYPDGGLISSLADLTLFTQEIIKGYTGESELLSHDAFKEMLDVQFKGGISTGIFWDISGSWRGHGGGDPGIYTLLWIDLEKQIGELFLTNIYADYSETLKDQIGDIREALGEYRKQLEMTSNLK